LACSNRRLWRQDVAYGIAATGICQWHVGGRHRTHAAGNAPGSRRQILEHTDVVEGGIECEPCAIEIPCPGHACDRLR
jgi:hypothetical protein